MKTYRMTVRTWLIFLWITVKRVTKWGLAWLGAVYLAQRLSGSSNWLLVTTLGLTLLLMYATGQTWIDIHPSDPCVDTECATECVDGYGMKCMMPRQYERKMARLGYVMVDTGYLNDGLGPDISAVIERLSDAGLM